MSATILKLDCIIKDVPSGAWAVVSESEHRVISYGIDAQAVLAEAKSKGERCPLLVRKSNQPSTLFF